MEPKTAAAKTAAAETVELTATAALNALTCKLTMFRTFAGLVAGGEDIDGTIHETDYKPSIYPQPYSTAEERRDYRMLADAYDTAQAQRGDRRRANRGDVSWWRPRRARTTATAREVAADRLEALALKPSRRS